MRKILPLILSLLLCANAWGGVDFSGDGDYITASDPYSGNQSNFSICAWVYPDTQTTDDAITAHYGTSVADAGFYFWRDDVAGISGRTDCFSALVGTTGTDYRVEGATNSATSGALYHVCMVFDSVADTLRLYINGVEDANSPDSSGSGDMLGAAAVQWIGSFSASGGTSAFDGNILELAGWLSTLTGSQVLQLYNSKLKRLPLQINSSTLIFYYPFDDQPDGSTINGDTYKDLSSSGFSGTGVDAGTNSLNSAETFLSYP